MALTVGDRDVRPLTQDEVMRMVELGILSEDEPVELLHGVLTRMSPKSRAHGTLIARLVRSLILGDAVGRYEVRTEHPILVPDRTSLPEPDIAVVVCDDFTIAHPATALLVVEVAVSSFAVDRKIKAALYAAAAVPEYWIVDAARRRVIMLRDPEGDRYTSEEIAGAADTIEPAHVDAGSIDLAALFAGL